MPEVLSALIAFVGQHRRCGDWLDRGVVWLECSCGAELVRPAAYRSDLSNKTK